MIPTFDRIDHIHVYVTDRAASERWYAEVMGLVRVPELERWAADGPLTLLLRLVPCRHSPDCRSARPAA